MICPQTKSIKPQKETLSGSEFWVNDALVHSLQGVFLINTVYAFIPLLKKAYKETSVIECH